MKLASVLTASLIAFATMAQADDPKFNAPPPADGHAYPDCYCTNRGVKVPIGTVSCLNINNREFTARCGWSLNTPAWRDKKEGCEPQSLSLADPDSEFAQPG